jgi:PHD/YefM family antitoxin component YafN of YafNO toxin-antitoxin module
MTTVTTREARANLSRHIDSAASSHQPILIAGERNNAVLISEEDWSADQETLVLLSVPGTRESIREGPATPVSECARELDW